MLSRLLACQACEAVGTARVQTLSEPAAVFLGKVLYPGCLVLDGHGKWIREWIKQAMSFRYNRATVKTKCCMYSTYSTSSLSNNSISYMVLHFRELNDRISYVWTYVTLLSLFFREDILDMFYNGPLLDRSSIEKVFYGVRLFVLPNRNVLFIRFFSPFLVGRG